MKIMKKLIVLLVIAGLCGCATTQRGVSQYEADKKIKKGETTKQEVLQIFGPPNITSTVADISLWTGISIPEEAKSKVKEIWTYSKMNMNILGGTIGLLFGSSVSSKWAMLQIFFDEKDVVIDYTVTTSQF